MKKTLLILILMMSSIPFSLVVGQNQKIPNWICGSWENTFTSDLTKSVVWTFAHDSIFVRTGLPNARVNKCLSHEYPGYRQTEHSEGNLYRITFSKGKDTVVYEFKLDYDPSTGKPALTYSLTINGKKKVGHSVSADSLFFRILH